MITGRYVLALKSVEDKEERDKARYVAGGQVDILKDYLVHEAQTIRLVSLHIILVVAKIKDICICVVDFKLAYLRSDRAFIRKIFITNPATRFELSPEEFLELHKSIYGIADLGDE